MTCVSRRKFIAGGIAAAAATMWTPAFRVTPAEAAADHCIVPPAGFPVAVELYRQAFENWSGEVVVDDVWTCAPRSAEDVLLVADWAVGAGFVVRPRGMMHGWSPLTIDGGSACDRKVLLVDTTQHLNGITVVPGEPAKVVAGCGATMDSLLGRLEDAGYGLTATPAPGDITVGGAIAIDGHGAAVPAVGEQRRAGASFGSLSNLVLSITVVAWDARARRHVLRALDRADRAVAPVLASLGRAFVTEVTLQVAENVNLRCQSFVDVPASELFAAPGTSGARTLASFVDESGRAEAIWYAFTDSPWLKVWTVAPSKPLTSRHVNSPYNYPFSDNVPDEVAELGAELLRGNGASTPAFGQLVYGVTAAGLVATASADIWGPSKNTLLYIRPSTLRVTANGYAVLTRRSDVQRVLHEFVSQHLDRVEQFRSRGLYPANMALEIRVTGLDVAADVDLVGAAEPALSALTPDAGHLEWDVAVWFDVLSLPGTPGANEFYRATEEWLFATFNGSWARARVEWSKGWGYTDAGAWRSPTVLEGSVPESFGRQRWDAAVRALDALDPHRIFSSPLLDSLAAHRSPGGEQ